MTTTDDTDHLAAVLAAWQDYERARAVASVRLSADMDTAADAFRILAAAPAEDAELDADARTARAGLRGHFARAVQHRMLASAHEHYVQAIDGPWSRYWALLTAHDTPGDAA